MEGEGTECKAVMLSSASSVEMSVINMRLGLEWEQEHTGPVEDQLHEFKQ